MVWMGGHKKGGGGIIWKRGGYIPSANYALSQDIDDQRIMQSDWRREATPHTQPKVVVLDATFHWWLTPCKKTKILRFFPQILMIKESYNLIGWEAQLVKTNQKL